MISSEIARANGRAPLSRLRGSGKVNRSKSNPQLLTQADSLTLSSSSNNTNVSGKITAQSSTVSVMRPLGSDRSQSVLNSANGGEVAPKSSVTKYANPPAVEVNGQMWAIAH